jgi:hypothetical protein
MAAASPQRHHNRGCPERRRYPASSAGRFLRDKVSRSSIPEPWLRSIAKELKSLALQVVPKHSENQGTAVPMFPMLPCFPPGNQSSKRQGGVHSVGSFGKGRGSMASARESILCFKHDIPVMQKNSGLLKMPLAGALFENFVEYASANWEVKRIFSKQELKITRHSRQRCSIFPRVIPRHTGRT